MKEEEAANDPNCEGRVFQLVVRGVDTEVYGQNRPHILWNFPTCFSARTHAICNLQNIFYALLTLCCFQII